MCMTGEVKGLVLAWQYTYRIVQLQRRIMSMLWVMHGWLAYQNAYHRDFSLNKLLFDLQRLGITSTHRICL